MGFCRILDEHVVKVFILSLVVITSLRSGFLSISIADTLDVLGKR